MAINLNEDIKYYGFRPEQGAFLILGVVLCAGVGLVTFISTGIGILGGLLFFGGSSVWIAFMVWLSHKPPNYLFYYLASKRAPIMYSTPSKLRRAFWAANDDNLFSE